MSSAMVDFQDFQSIMDAQSAYLARQVRLEPLREAYVEFLCGDDNIPETYVVYLKSGFGENNRRRFLTVAYQLSKVEARERGQRFEEILSNIDGAIQEEVDRDGPDVMNMAGVAHAIRENKELIFSLAGTIVPRIQAAKIQMAWNGFSEFQTSEPDAIFKELVPYSTL